uniref:Septin 10 n=1 Tax=Cyprinus carpio TaxID=7962 RepID=A0A8C1NSU4_CYPCA
YCSQSEYKHLMNQSEITNELINQFIITNLNTFPNDKNARPLALSGHVGFDSLPDQLVNKSTSQGFCFNILCIGETGIGKSTLMDTLLNTNFENFESSHFEPKVKLRAQTYDLQESNVRLKLTVVNTVGFGDQMNKQERSVVLFLITAAIRWVYSRSFTRVFTPKPEIHSPASSASSLIPLLTGSFLVSEFSSVLFQGHLPFAVVGSTEEVNIGSKMVKARQYPWGVVQGEPERNKCVLIYESLDICTGKQDRNTEEEHVEFKPLCLDSLQQTYEEKRQEFLGELQRREEEMRQTFVQRVKEKESELKDAERELQGKFEQLKRLHAEEKSKLEEKRRSLEEDMSVFSKRRAASELLQAQAFNTNNKKDKDRKK